MKRIALVVWVMVAACPQPLIADESPPTASEAKASATAAREKVRLALDAAVKKFDRSPAGLELRGKVDELESAIPGASPEQRAALSRQLVEARTKLAEGRAAARAQDQAVRDATAEGAAAIAEGARVEAKERTARLAAEYSAMKIQKATRDMEGLKVGAIGLLPVFRVVQVLDGQSALVSPADNHVMVIIKGIDTSAMVDGQTLTWKKPAIISGTQTYKTAIGGTNTVFVAEPYSP